MSVIELIKKIEYITLEQFIPNWTELIEEMDERNLTCEIIDGDLASQHPRIKYAQSQGLEYADHKSCLVGEANHYSDDYKCNDECEVCTKLAYFDHAGQALLHGKETFQNFKLELFTHMLETHTELMLRHD